MVKTIGPLYFSAEEYTLLETAKQDHTWREFMLSMVETKKEVHDND